MNIDNVENVFKYREDIRTFEDKIGMESLTESERAIVEFIAERDGTRITDILNNPYFKDLSISTVKRHIAKLKKSKHIKHGGTENTGDKRNKPLIIV